MTLRNDFKSIADRLQILTIEAMLAEGLLDFPAPPDHDQQAPKSSLGENLFPNLS